MRSGRAQGALAAVLLLMLGVTACSSDTKATAGTSAASSRGVAPATGDPVKIFNIATLESPKFSAPQVKVALDAAVNALNQRGGIGGHPVEVTYCNDKFDANAGSACARQAVDSGSVAVVGGESPVFPAYAAVLEAAKLPWIGGLGTSPAELNSPISYPLQGSIAATTAGLFRFLAKNGGHKIVLITGDDTSSLSIPDLARPAVQAGGAELTKVVTGATGHPDWTAEVATAISSNPDAVAFSGSGLDVPKVITALRQAGYNGLIGVPGSVFTPPVIKALGPAAEGVYASLRLGSPDETSNPEIQRFQKELAAQDPNTQPDEITLNTWTALQLFAEVTKTIQEPITPASVTAAFDGLQTPVKLGVVPDYPPVPSSPPNASAQRVRKFFVVVAQIKDGKYVRQGDFFDPFGP